MSDVTQEELLAKVNNPAGSRAMRWARRGIVVSGLLATLVAGAIINNLVGGWWAQRKLDRANIDTMVLIIQYNIQNGKLALPPQLQTPPPAAPTPAPPAPAPAPAQAKPAEAPPKK